MFDVISRYLRYFSFTLRMIVIFWDSYFKKRESSFLWRQIKIIGKGSSHSYHGVILDVVYCDRCQYFPQLWRH